MDKFQFAHYIPRDNLNLLRKKVQQVICWTLLILYTTLPTSALSKVAMILIIVVFHAPLEPSKAKIPPCSTSKFTPLSTSTSLYDFFNPLTSIIFFSLYFLLFNIISLLMSSSYFYTYTS